MEGLTSRPSYRDRRTHVRSINENRDAPNAFCQVFRVSGEVGDDDYDWDGGDNSYCDDVNGGCDDYDQDNEDGDDL